MLNFAVLMGCGVFIVVWPKDKVTAKSIYSLKMWYSCSPRFKKAMPFSTGDSHFVPNSSTKPAQRCLTSQFWWDAVCSSWYDRKTKIQPRELKHPSNIIETRTTNQIFQPIRKNFERPDYPPWHLFLAIKIFESNLGTSSYANNLRWQPQ